MIYSQSDKHFALLFFFFLNDTAPTEFYSLPLHAALPIFGETLCEEPPHDVDPRRLRARLRRALRRGRVPLQDDRLLRAGPRSEEHTSELQSPCNLVCRLLLEKKKFKIIFIIFTSRTSFFV